jgi:hypothetical protein
VARVAPSTSSRNPSATQTIEKTPPWVAEVARMWRRPRSGRTKLTPSRLVVDACTTPIRTGGWICHGRP